VRTVGAQLGGIWRLVKWALIGLAVLFFLLLALEATHAVQASGAIHPALGVLVFLAIAGATAALAFPLWRLFWMPRVIVPPKLPADGTYDRRHVAAQCRYLDRYLRNCRRNPELLPQLGAIDAAILDLAATRPRLESAAAVDLAAARVELGRWVARHLTPLLAPLDQKAERLIHQEALSVGLGTAISPNGTLDAFVVLWRSIQLTSKLAVLYYGRPGPLGALRVLADVALAAAAASYMQSVGNSLGGLVARSLGGIAGVVAGPATQGITNALVMVRLGSMVQERCRSFRRWDPVDQRSAVAAALVAAQRHAVGLVTEILRQAGSGLGAVAGVAARGMTHAAGGVASAAGAAFDFAREVGQRISNGLRSLAEPDDRAPADAEQHAERDFTTPPARSP